MLGGGTHMETARAVKKNSKSHEFELLLLNDAGDEIELSCYIPSPQQHCAKKYKTHVLNQKNAF